MRTAHLNRAGVAVALVVTAALTTVSVLTMPDLGGGQVDRLRSIAADPGLATLSAWTWVVAQLFLGAGALGVAHLARPRSPVLATAGGVLTGLGVFGHCVHGGITLLMLSMAQDLGSATTSAAALDRAEVAMIPVLAAGLVGTVLGFALLGAALWRARVGQRWLGPLMIAWVVVEFGISGLSQWGGYASALLYAVALAGLAGTVARSPLDRWAAASTASPARTSPQPVPGVGPATPQAARGW